MKLFERGRERAWRDVAARASKERVSLRDRADSCERREHLYYALNDRLSLKWQLYRSRPLLRHHLALVVRLEMACLP